MLIGKNVVTTTRAHQDAGPVRFFRIRKKDCQAGLGDVGNSKDVTLGFTFLLTHFTGDFPGNFVGPQKMRFAPGIGPAGSKKRKSYEQQ